MILIQKGKAPDKLTKDGREFEIAALLWASGGDCGDEELADQFENHAKTNSQLKGFKVQKDGIEYVLRDGFAGFKSALFSTYNYYSHATVKAQLVKEHYGKCAYCESLLRHVGPGDVEHYSPKAEVEVLDLDTASKKTKALHPGYFWLSQTWENLVLACAGCNQGFKGNRFDLFNDAQLLLNPADAALDPRDVLKFHPVTAKARPQPGGPGDPNHNGGRAQRTIEIVGLNRPRLIQARAAHLVKLRALFVLAAHEGTLRVEDVNGETVDVRNLQFSKSCAGLDAVAALKLACTPEAEYSALAMDAIEAWNPELEFTMKAVPLSHHHQIQVYVVTSQLRLEVQVSSESELTSANVDEVAVRDHTEEDRDYNKALGEYKAAVARAKKWFAASKVEQQQAAELYELYDRCTQDHDEAFHRRRRAQQVVLWQMKQRGSDDPETEEDRASLREFSAMTEKERLEAINQFSEGSFEKFDKDYHVLEERCLALEKEKEQMLWPPEEMLGDLMRLEGEAAGVLSGYQIKEADVASRSNRALELLEAVRMLTDALENGTRPALLKSHMAGKKLPAAIRGA